MRKDQEIKMSFRSDCTSKMSTSEKDRPPRYTLRVTQVGGKEVDLVYSWEGEVGVNSLKGNTFV